MGTTYRLVCRVLVAFCCFLAFSPYSALSQNCSVHFISPSDWATCSAGGVYMSSGCGSWTAVPCSDQNNCTVNIDISWTKAQCGGGDCVDMSGHLAGQSYTVYLTKSGCAANGPTLATNYVRCITWTNNTGHGVGYTFFQDVDPVNCGTNWVDYSAISGYVFPGSYINKCFTNRCPNPIHLYVAPWQGAPRENWVNPTDEVVMAATNTVDQTQQSAQGQTPINQGLGGAGFNPNTPGQAGGGGTNTSPTTNLVRWFNIAPTNGISGGGATSQDIYNLGDALIRAGERNADRIVDAIHASGTNGFGDRGASNAVRNFHRDATNLLTGMAGSLDAIEVGVGSNGVIRAELTNGFERLTNRMGIAEGRDLTTNAFGTVTGIAGESGALWDNYYSGASNAMGGQYGSGFTNGLGVNSGINVAVGVGSFPGVDLLQFDFRPSQWHSSVVSLAAASRALLSILVTALFYWCVWRDFENRSRSLQAASAGVGKSLSSASIAGATAGTAIKFVVANIITVGLSGLPTLVVSFLSSFGFDVFDVSFVEVAQAAAGGEVADRMVDLWGWFSSMFPVSVLVAACINYGLWKTFAFGFETVWYIVIRAMPIAVLYLGYDGVTQGADYLFNNQASQAAAIIAGGETHWFQPGCHYVRSFPDTVTVAYGLGATNGNTVNALADFEWTMIVVSENSTNNLIPVIGVTGFQGFVWSFGQGFVFGCLFVVVAFTVVMIKRTFRMGFGSIGE